MGIDLFECLFIFRVVRFCVVGFGYEFHDVAMGLVYDDGVDFDTIFFSQFECDG